MAGKFIANVHLIDSYSSLLKMNYGIDLNKLSDKAPEGMKPKDPSEIVKYDIEQIFDGIDTEMEHTDDPYVALTIAMDHLEEDPYYYSKNKD